MPAAINRRRCLHRGRVFELVSENITLENGVTTDMEFIHHPGATAIIPLLDATTVILIKQYRHSLRQSIWEVPAGTLEPGEDAGSCAKRELAEETGFRAGNWHRLGQITPLPGYSDERIHLFAATGLRPSKQNLDADEILKVHEIKLDTAMEMIGAGEIQDGKTIAGLFLARQWLRENRPA